MMRYELTDYEWAAISPMLPNKARGTTCYNRFVRWRRGAGVWGRIMDALAAAHDAAVQNVHPARASARRLHC
jgi:transposase